MKKYLFVFVLLIFNCTAYSQVLLSLLFGDKLNSDGLEFGLEGGVSWCQIDELDSHNSLTSFNLGFYFDIRLNDPWYIATGVLVKSKLGADELSPEDLDFLEIVTYPEQGSYSQKLNYFQVPVLIRYKFQNNVFIEAGPQFSLMHKAWVEFESETDDREARIRQYNKDAINRLDAGMTGGLGYKFPKGIGIGVGIRYYYGFANVYKDRSGSNNSALFLRASVPIGAGRGEAKDEF
jgi:hypothetical protein